MKRTLSSLLVLVLLLTALPLSVSAATEIKGFDSATVIQEAGTGKGTVYVNFPEGTLVYYDGYVVNTGGLKGYYVGQAVTLGKGGTVTWIAAHQHEYEWTVNRDGHFYRCTCGAKHHFAEHTMQADGRCACGYKFMDNADLTVLWMRGIKLSPRFNKGVTEYEGTLTMKNLEKTKISAFSFDAKASIELPKDLTLKKGTNTFEVKVTAEDGKTTKTYTVTVEKE